MAALGCRPSPADAEIDRLETRMDRHELAIDRAESIVRRLESRWSSVVDEYGAASDGYRSARAEYERAAAAFARSSLELREATDRWTRAKARWDLASQLVIAAAALDAYNLAQFQSGSRVDLSDIDCGRVSTRAFRRQLREQGVDLTGKDIDHIVPRALGGADHPRNYQAIDSSLNRSLGATWNAEKCAMAGQAICKAAVAVSKMCGTFSG